MARNLRLIAAFDGPRNSGYRMPGKPLVTDGPGDLGETVAYAEQRAAQGLPAAPGALKGLDKPGVDSSAMSVYWDKVDAILGGVDALKAGGKKWLPAFPNEALKDYAFRSSLAKFTNVFEDIVEDLSARPFAEEIKLPDLPSTYEEFVKNVDGAGSTITAFAADMMFNGIARSVDWLFVDFPTVVPNSDGSARTKQQDKQEGIRPFWSHIRASNVLEVRSEIRNGNEQITYFRVLEPDANGGKTRVRVMELNGQATWSVFEQSKINKDEWVLANSGIFTIGVIPVVPFITGRREGRSWQIKPPMKAAADLSINLYRSETDLENAKVKTAFAMIAANGVNPEKDAAGNPKRVTTGPGMFLYGGMNGNGNAGSFALLEPSATSLQFLATDITNTILQLRELGRQPLTAQSGNLTVITTAVAAMKGNSAVKAWAIFLGFALEAAMKLTAQWMNDGDYTDPKVNVYKDFQSDNDGKDQDTLNTMRANGDLSQETLWLEMSRRGVLSPDFDPDEEKERLLDETPGDVFDDEPPNGGTQGNVPPPTNPKGNLNAEIS